MSKSTNMPEPIKLTITPRQKLSLLVIAAGSLLSSTKFYLGLPNIMLYVSLATIVIGVILFVTPFAFGGLKKSLRLQAGQEVYAYFEKAGLEEPDMRKILFYAKTGHKIGFQQSNKAPYYQVMLTIQKFEGTEKPQQEDYWAWDEAVEYLENQDDD